MSAMTLESSAAAFFRASWQASLLALAILLLQSLLARRISAQMRYGLWSMVLLRLAIPLAIPSPLSAHNFYHSKRPAAVRSIASISSFVSNTPIVFSTSKPVVPIAPATWPQRLSRIWLAGCGISALIIALASWRLSLRVRRLRSVTDPRLLELLASCAAALKIRRLPRLLTGPSAGGPALIGVIRPCLVLPDAVLTFDKDALRLILLHELAHQKRLDVPANWLLALIQVLHWFNPFVYLICARIRADRELACDQRVLALTPSDNRPAYGRTIIQLIETLSAVPRSPLSAVGILEGRHQMKRRIAMIVEERSVRRTWSLLAMFASLLLAVVACTDAVRGDDATKAVSTSAAANISSSPGLSQPAAAPSQDARLEQRIPVVKFDSIPLREALAYMHDQSKMNLFIDEMALQAAGVDMNEPVTLDLKNVPLSQAFQLIGKSAADPGVELGAKIEGDVIIFTVFGTPPVSSGMSAPAPGAVSGPLHAANDRVVSQVYDVSVLTNGNPNQADSLASILRENLRVGKSSVFGSINTFGNKLILTATPDLQDQVQELLLQLKPTPHATTQPAPEKAGNS